MSNFGPRRVALLLAVVGFAFCAQVAAVRAEPLAPERASERFIVRIYYGDVGRISELSDLDLLEYRDKTHAYILAIVDADEAREIVSRGFALEVDEARTAEMVAPRPPAAAAIPGFACYRTVEETYATAQALVLDRPDLATWIDVGDTWEKSIGIGGFDLRVLRLTNSAIAGPKPKLIVSSSIHAREYAPAEVSTRFGEFLVKNHQTDADARWILDHHEIHLLLQANPDGRKKAESGLSWRKNTNQAYCGSTSVNRGADLNRNFAFRWGCCGGSSGSPCNSTYRGPAPASEPETLALQAYLTSEFPDQRAAPLGSPAPADATGLYVDAHSFGELLLWPWGFPGSAPNATALRTLGRKLAYFNGHEPQQAVDLYPTDGTTIDFVYGELGVASFVFEMGTAFFQDCSTFESTVFPDNFDALLYAAKVARTPYLTPAGPESFAAQVSPPVAIEGVSRMVTATADDARFNNSNGAEPTQVVSAAELYIDVPPWGPGATPIAMTAVDGTFDEPVEPLSLVLPTTALAAGRHLIFVRARDAAGNWGPLDAAFLDVESGPHGTLAGVVTESRTAEPLAAEVQAAGVTATTNPSTGAYAMSLPVGAWSAVASAPGHRDAALVVTVVDGGTTTQNFALTAAPTTLLVDDDDDSPDVRAAWTAALDAVDEGWEVWDTKNGAVEPGTADLSAFRNVLWFSGDDFGGDAGPSPDAESALSAWLDEGRCLLLASQDYYRDRGLTPFLNSRFGVGAVNGDVVQTTAAGFGAVFGGLGPYSLAFPYANATDLLAVAPPAELAFSGEGGPLGVSRDTEFWRTSFWSFGLETLPTPASRAQVLAAWIAWCREIPELDGDGDGVANAADCSPLDADSWALPSPASALRLTRLGGAIDWLAPSAPGSTGVLYDVLRASRLDLGDSSCLSAGIAATTASDTLEPPAASLWVYLVRVRNACGETLGANSAGVPRIAAACP